MYATSSFAQERASMAAMIERLAAEVHTTSRSQLATTWRALERRLLLLLRTDEHLASPLLPGRHAQHLQQTKRAHERLRNLSWEVAVSIDLQAVHVDAMLRLAALLRQAASDEPEAPRAWVPPESAAAAGRLEPLTR